MDRVGEIGRVVAGVVVERERGAQDIDAVKAVRGVVADAEIVERAKVKPQQLGRVDVVVVAAVDAPAVVDATVDVDEVAVGVAGRVPARYQRDLGRAITDDVRGVGVAVAEAVGIIRSPPR